MHFNSDLNEVNKFSKLSNEWWDLKGKFKALHAINPLRMSFIKEHGEISQKSKILDIGCGGGILTESLAEFSHHVTGIDLSKDSLNIAQLHAKNSNLNIEYIYASAEEFAKTEVAQFDVITCLELLEHVPNPESIIKACAKLLKPGGKLFISTINRNLKSKLLMIYGAEMLTKLVPAGTHDFNRFIRPSELINLLDINLFNTVEMKGIEYKIFHNNFILSDDVDVNYILYATKI